MGKSNIKSDSQIYSTEYHHMDVETLEAFAVKYVQTDYGEEYNMCQALMELQEDARNEGLREGIEKGIEVLIGAFKELGMAREITSIQCRFSTFLVRFRFDSPFLSKERL